MNLSNQTVHGSIGPSTNLQSVVLPNGVAWEFEYDDQDATLTYNGQPVTYGTLSKITLPTGASISYTWINAGASLAAKSSTFCNNGGRWLAGRTVTDLDGIARTWTYTYKVPFGSYFGTVVTDPLGNNTAHVFGFGGGCTAYETQTLYYLGSYSSGTSLRTVNTTYLSTANGNTFPNPVLNVVPTSTTTIEANNQTTATTKGYDSGFSYLDHFGSNTASGKYGHVTSEQVYDYGSGAHGALLRTINTTYAWQSPNPNYATYLSNNLLNLEYSVQIKDGGGTQRAYTFYGYDESGLVSSTITKQHSAGESRPGNETSVHRWLNGSTTATTNCNVSVSNGYLVSSKLYYDTGEVQKTTDPCGYITSFQYNAASPVFGAYLTTATNQLGQSTTYTYDSNPGVVTAIKDANLKITSKQYDVMNRVTQISFPDGGWITACYTDTGGSTCTHSAPPYEKVITKAITSSPTLSEISTLVFDGLGRLSQTQLNSDSPSATYTLTTYDALGRKSKVYNPTRCSPITTNCGESTWGYTTYIYDALGRPCVVVPPGGTAVSTCPTTAPAGDMFTSYTGRATSVQDEGNGGAPVQLISQVDGLGRLTSVCEVTSAPQLGSGGTPGACAQDITAAGFLTAYGYDVLGNVLAVNQGTLQPRTFAYDSLSRLLCAANPETWIATCPTPDTGSYTPGTTRYAYNANSNLSSRVRPAPNQTSLSTTDTVTYGYDALNRLTQQTYSDGVTPTVMFGYDQTSITMTGQTFSIFNNVGRLSWDATVNSSSYPIQMKAFSYDAMGRVAELWQKNPVNNNNIWISYQYDLLGDETNRDLNGTTDAATYSGAGRLTSFTATDYTDATNPANLLASALYDPFGHLVSATLANGLTESWGYDNRGRVTAMAVGTNCSVGNCSTNKYRFTTGYAPNSDIVSSTDTVNGNWTYTYDDLNRLSTGGANNGEGCSWEYDRYGNRWHQNAHSGSCPAPQYSFTGNNNHIDQYSANYDAVGNLLNDVSHSYQYDAENRIVSVDGGATTYAYDADGQRVAKTTGSVTTDFIYDREGHVMLYNSSPASGSSPFVEVNVGGLHLGTYVLNSAITDTIFYYNHDDWLGTERARTDLSGTACETITSLPFGDNQTISGTCGDISPLHFTGKERDTESGLDNFGARYNASSMGRFMAPDPKIPSIKHLLNPQKWNKYAYVLNNPLSLVDPDGMEEMTIVFRAFIPQSNVAYIGRGDNRSFSTQPNASSRISVTMHIETDPAKNHGHPLIGNPDVQINTSHNNLTGNNTPAVAAQAPTVTPSQDANGNVNLNVQMDVHSGDLPAATSIRSDVNIGVNEPGTQGSVQGTVSGSPAFETNFTPQGGPTTNLPVQDASSNAVAFTYNLTKTNTVDKETPIQQPSPQQ
jgi:RHS repeat-associated protein